MNMQPKGCAPIGPLAGRRTQFAGAASASTLMRRLSLSNATFPSTRANKVQSRPVPTLLPATNFVPRWRTRMLPAVTNSPPNRFTPSLLLTLSRPLRTLPPPFLCAIISSFDFCNFNDRQFLSMPDGLVIAFASFHFEGNHFRAALVFHHISHYARLGDRR